MQCLYCSYTNLAEARFCANCGRPLSSIPAAPALPPSGFTSTPIPARTAITALPYAGFGIRLVAFFVDTFVVMAIVFLLFLLMGLWLSVVSGPVADTVSGILGLVALPGSGFAYYVLTTARSGQTLGKRAMGIRVVALGGKPLSLQAAMMREVVGKTIAWIAAGFGLVWIAANAQKQGWHDLMAGTIVVRVYR